MTTRPNNVFAIAAAAFTLVCQTAPAYANTAPSTSLLPLSSVHIEVSSAAHACNAPAGVDGNPYFEMPEIAEVEGAHGTAQVKIDLTSAGNLAAEQLLASSGNQLLDLAALRSARMTRFTPQTVNCQHIAGSYLYEVEF